MKRRKIRKGLMLVTLLVALSFVAAPVIAQGEAAGAGGAGAAGAGPAGPGAAPGPSILALVGIVAASVAVLAIGASAISDQGGTTAHH